MAEAGPGTAGGYVAFISYSHKDAAAGRWLHRKLEGYRLPKRLAGTQGEDGEVPARLSPIFRDRDELPAAGDLSERVRGALAVSKNLIVLCSPSSAASPWVAKEIATFRELHPGRPIFTAIVAGEPGQCFSPALLEGGAEPLAADLRKEGDGPRLGLLKLVAGLAGVGLDALIQRDASRRIRRVTYVTAAAVAAMLAMALMTALALNARAEAQRQRQEAEGLVEFMLTDLRRDLKSVAGLPVLTAVNERALRYYQDQDLNGLPPDSLQRRARILHAMGDDDQKRGNLDRALAQFLEASRTTAALVAADPDNADRIFAHSQSEYYVGSIAQQRGNYVDALAAYRRYREAAKRMYRLAPRNAKYVGEIAYAESNLGSLKLDGLKEPAAARQNFHRSLEWFEKAALLEPRNATWKEEAADAHSWIGRTWFSEQRYGEARSEHLIELSTKEKLLRSDPDNQSYVYALVIAGRSLARIDMASGNLRRARIALDEARARMDHLIQSDQTNVMWRDQATRIEADLTSLWLASDHLPEARSALLRADRLLRESSRLAPEYSADRQTLRRRLQNLQVQLNAAPSKGE
jgi:tetratricopeptide (TPR) repeat protein